MKAIILAGGFGTRLSKHVPDLPKPMAPVAGRPLLEYILDRLIDGGINEIILSVGYRADVIIEHFGDEYRNTKIYYAIENEPLGTGGAIMHAFTKMGDESVLVLNGDTFLDVDYSELLRWYGEAPAQVAMVLRSVPDISRYGAVLVSDGRVTGFLEKGESGEGLINAGVYIVKNNVFEPYDFPVSFSFEADFLEKHCAGLSPRAFVTDGYFIDIGVPDDYDRAQHELPSLL